MTTESVDKVIMILGDSEVGKTTLISNFYDFEFKIDSNDRISPLKEKEKTICKIIFKKVWITQNSKRKSMINYID